MLTSENADLTLARAAGPSDQTVTADLARLRALGDPMRLEIVRLLSVEQLCTCHLVDELGARQTNVSNHLRILRAAGIVESEAAGRYIYHRLRPEALDQLALSFAETADGARRASDSRRPSC